MSIVLEQSRHLDAFLTPEAIRKPSSLLVGTLCFWFIWFIPGSGAASLRIARVAKKLLRAELKRSS